MAARLSWIGMMVGVVAFAGAQEHNPITYTTAAIPASRAIDEIARQSGEKLTVEPPLDTEPLILSLHGAITQDVLGWIAEALNGTWSDDGHTKALRRNKYLTSVLSSADRLARAKLISETLEQVQQEGRRPYWTKEAAARAVASGESDKANRALISRIYEGLNATELAGARFPYDIVYATSPRPLQFTLRLDSNSMRSLFEEQNAWTRAMQDSAKEHHAPGSAAGRRLINPGKARLLVVCSDDIGLLPRSVTVEILDPGGYPYVRATSAFTSTGYTPGGPHHAALEPIQFSDLAHSFVNAASVAGAAPPSKDLQDFLQHPATHDPLELILSEGLLTEVQSQHLNLVACVPDAALFDSRLQSLADYSRDNMSFIEALKAYCSVKTENDAVVVSPISPVVATAYRTNRGGLEAFLKSLSDMGYASIDAQAAFAASNGVSPELASMWTRLTHPGMSAFVGSSRTALPFYAKLSVRQKKILMDGIALHYTDLSDIQKSLLIPMMFDKPDDIYVGRSPSVLRPGMEPSELLDQDLQQEVAITMEEIDEKDVHVEGVTVAGEAINDIWSSEEAPSRLAYLAPWQTLRYTVGMAKAVRLILQVNPSVRIIHTLREIRAPFKKAVLTTLPSEWQAGLPPDPALQEKLKKPAAVGKKRKSS